MPPVKPIDSILDIGSYAGDRKVAFRLVGGGRLSGALAATVEIPLPIVYRLYHLGRAYDFQTIS